MLRKWISLRYAYTATRRAEKLEVWDQIRRTEEEPMEVGTIEHALLLKHRVVAKGTVSMAAEPNKVVA